MAGYGVILVLAGVLALLYAAGTAGAAPHVAASQRLRDRRPLRYAAVAGAAGLAAVLAGLVLMAR